MYKEPLYGKEWAWRNVKMEARELHIVLRSWGREKGFTACMREVPFLFQILR